MYLLLALSIENKLFAYELRKENLVTRHMPCLGLCSHDFFDHGLTCLDAFLQGNALALSFEKATELLIKREKSLEGQCTHGKDNFFIHTIIADRRARKLCLICLSHESRSWFYKMCQFGC